MKDLTRLIVVVLLLAGSAFAQNRKPNIILIYADDLGYGDIGPFGQKYIKTPNLDKLAAGGLKFTNFYASAPVCAPSRASIMTGFHQGRAVIRGNNNDRGARVPLRPSDVTVAEVMKSAGYRTAMIRKWGLGLENATGEPRKQGYDYFFGYLDQQHAHDYYPSYLWRNEEKIELGKKVYSHTLFEKETLDFIESSKGGPFFMYLPFTLPHANNELGRATGNGMQVPTDAPYSSEPWSPQQRNYAAMVTLLDATVGKIRDTLKKLGLEDDTIIIFTSDNGPQSVVEGGYDQTLFQSNGGLRGLKRSLYEGGIREPLIFYWKGKIKPNRSSDAVWAQYDFLPTFAEIAGAKLTEKTDGISMVPLLFGKKHRTHDFLYFEFYEGGFIQAVRMGDWKGFRRGLEGKLELYNLKKDPRESDNIASKNPKTVAKIEAIMAREHVPSDNWAADDGD